MEEGLAHRNVVDVSKDDQGFLWIATLNDIQRYDGYEFKTFPLPKHQEYRLDVDIISQTNDGWLYFIALNPTARHYTLIFLHPITGETATIEEKLGKHLAEQLDVLLNDVAYYYTGSHRIKNRVYFSSSKEVVVVDFAEGIQKFSYPAEHQEEFTNNHVHAIRLIDSKGNFWITKSPELELYKFTPESGVLELVEDENIGKRIFEWNDEVYLIDVNNSNDTRIPKLKKYHPSGRVEEILEFPKGWICHEFTNGKLWCKTESGWKILDLSGKLIQELDKADYGPELFGRMDYKKIHTDELGKTYLNSLHGFNIIEFKKNPFTHYFSKKKDVELPINNAARGIHVQGDTIVVSFEFGGLVLFDKNAPDDYQIMDDQKLINGKLTGYSARPVLRDSKGNYWLNHMDNHLQSKWSPNFSKLEKIKKPTTSDNQYDASWAIWEDENACIWSAYLMGFRKTCQEDSIQTSYLYKDMGIGTEVNEFIIYQFIQREDGLVWICSENGLYLFDKDRVRIIEEYSKRKEGEYYLPENNIFHMHIDADGNRWMGTRTGLLFWNVSTGEKRLFNRNDGLINNVIYAVYEDNDNRLWLSSDYGIMSFNKETFDVRTYSTKEGISHQEFNRISHFKAEDGTIYFGGLNGVNAFHPDQFTNQEKKQYKLHISECLLFDGQTEKEINIIQEVLETETITFRPSDRYFKLKFTQLNFEDRYESLYAWKIDGVYDEWNYEKENALQFGALPYGHHTLIIKGQSASGGWSPNELQIQIRVLKPFYLQSWFLLLSVASIAGAIFMFFRSRTRRLRKAKENLEKEVFRATAQIQKDKQLIEEQAEELKQLDKVKSRFFANVSHELRTPLTLILGPIGSAMKSGTLDTRNMGLMKKASRSGRELLKLVGSILDLSKMDSGKIEVHEQAEFLFPLMDRMVNSFESHAQSKGITFNFEYSARKDLQVMLDRNKIEVVINNLLSNACKFTPDKGTITTTISEDRDILLIRVKDTGRGIHPKDQAHVFDRFYQSQLADAPTEGGTGIGLALSYEFVQMMGGNISLESEFGNGTTFTVGIPKKETDTLIMSEKEKDYFFTKTPNLPEEVEKDTTQLQPSQFEDRPTILVTEDNYSLRDYIVTILSPFYNVRTAENGLKALEELQQNKDIQLIMSDIMMPEMDGFQLLEMLKSKGDYRHIPVVMLTARADIKDKLKALRIGVDDYLLKPFEEEELLVRIENLLHNYQERVNFHKEEKSENGKISIPSISEEDMEWLGNLEQFLQAHISNSSYSITQLSFDMAISERQLRRRLKQLTGLTPVQYFLEIRLGKAREYLEEKKFKTVAQTAFAVGFQAPRAFSRSFNQKFGKSPSFYINS